MLHACHSWPSPPPRICFALRAEVARTSCLLLSGCVLTVAHCLGESSRLAGIVHERVGGTLGMKVGAESFRLLTRGSR